ncbi:FAD-dependent oxidoreductase [Methylobacterium nodulans]|uniref:Monooxygenase FAD-binding n=1 Tax=Methylobacterium nodulans (strain LMG 21967 / CNCM I-2342 / ORS 2060) TaxID=460265 RepID=B8IXI0_METNO|nr:FAD-dependent monooxygenase [Methylobacterium nodulans]ACL62812.1 monooxygenase FAD-binding [Methylobacterium nodulans ORS 2060]
MKIGIVGAGLNGLAFALLLKRFGLKAEIFERGDGPRDAGSGIYLWPQGVQVLRFMIGDDRVLAAGQPIEYLDTHDRGGRLIHRQPVRLEGFEFPAPAVMFHRTRLFRLLREALDADAVAYNSACTGIEQDADGVTAHFADGRSRRFDLLVGADGVFSGVRGCIAPEAVATDTGVAACRGIVTFSDPALHGDRCQIFSYDGARVVTYPLDVRQGLRYWFYAYRHGGRPLLGKAAIMAQVSGLAEPLPAMIAATGPDAMISNRLHRVDGLDAWHRGRVVLLGDSAHAMLPTLGYGFTLGLENGFALAQALLCNCDATLESGLRRFDRRVRLRSREMVAVMSDLTDLFYFQKEGAVTRDSLQAHMARFRTLAETTLF